MWTWQHVPEYIRGSSAPHPAVSTLSFMPDWPTRVWEQASWPDCGPLPFLAFPSQNPAPFTLEVKEETRFKLSLRCHLGLSWGLNNWKGLEKLWNFPQFLWRDSGADRVWLKAVGWGKHRTSPYIHEVLFPTVWGSGIRWDMFVTVMPSWKTETFTL